jgi:hypothetical protein
MVEKAPQRQPIRVSYEAKNGARETTTASDLSLGGLFVETTQKSPAIGAFVALEIESGATKVAIDGRVLSSSPTGFAVRFIDLPNDVASALSFILATRVPRRGTTLGLGEAEEGVAKYESARSLPSAAAAPAAPAPPPEPAPTPPRNPTPRMVPAAPPVAAVVPPAPTTSSPAVVSIGTPRPSAPPSAPPPMPSARPAPMPMPMPMPMPGPASFDATATAPRSRAPMVIAIVVVALLLVVGLVVGLAR